MTHALVTIMCPLGIDRLPEAEMAIGALGNPAREEIVEALDVHAPDDPERTHFMSLHAIYPTDGGAPYLLFEFSADGSEEAAIVRLMAIEAWLRPIFSLASDWTDGGDFAAYLLRHRISIGGGWFDNPGVPFAGTPEMTVGRVRSESALAARITSLLADQPANLSALERVSDVRARLRGGPFEDQLQPGEPVNVFRSPSWLQIIARFGWSFFVTYLWPIALACVAWGIFVAMRRYDGSDPDALQHFVWHLLCGTSNAAIVALVLVVVALVATYFLLRAAEDTDFTDDRAAERDVNAAIFARENITSQNHMISVTRRKPGPIRFFTSRLVFWALGRFVGFIFPLGFLGSIGTIHFARWVAPPGTQDLVFLSNYDGSWESYLEDFITLAHNGLTAVWSNTVGFPRTTNLIQQGATDGERFKRYARRSTVPTLFWYSAYPNLSTSIIRTNAKIRRGLSGVMSSDEANEWLALFGSAGRPVSKLVNSEIQSLIFGGLGFLEHGSCLIQDLPDDPRRAHTWLDAISQDIALNDGRRLGVPAVLTLALGAGGLRKLGLPEQAIESFPYTFLEGMNNPARARILGDIGPSAAGNWRWGQTQPDVALLIYGESEKDVDALQQKVLSLNAALDINAYHLIPLKTITEDKREPFGFVDGISQPAIRGTYKGLRNPDPIHLVEPGEFILGYPDNRENLPPGPQMSAVHDSQNLLPLVTKELETGFSQNYADCPRDVGFNGSFLVIRELEQDVEGFDDFCAKEADALQRAQRLPPPYKLTPEFIAAKLVGRWHDGSSLARFPYESRTDEKTLGSERKPASHVTTRPTSAPSSGEPSIARPTEQNPKGDNDFLFGTEDPEGMRCPFGAHIRRANPRDSLNPGSADQIAISNRHRIIRVGRFYEPSHGMRPGLLFMCLNADIERQFEFLQQTWLRSSSFHGLSCEKDPLLGDGEEGVCGFTIPSRSGPVRLGGLPQFVTTRGGGYFFLPGKRLIDYLRQP